MKEIMILSSKNKSNKNFSKKENRNKNNLALNTKVKNNYDNEFVQSYF